TPSLCSFFQAGDGIRAFHVTGVQTCALPIYYQNGPSYRCLFPNPPQKDAIPNCAEIGVLGVLPGIIGSFQANEVLKMILGIENVLSGKLLCFNALTSETSILKINKSEEQIEKILKEKHLFHLRQLESNCEFPSDDVSIKEVTNFENAQFIDVREAHE